MSDEGFKVSRLKFLQKWWESLLFGFATVIILVILAGLTSELTNLVVSYFIMGFVIAFTTVVILRFYRNTTYFRTHAEISLMIGYAMFLSALLTLTPIILFNYGMIDARTMYSIERFFLYRIEIPQFNITYGFTPVLVVVTSLLSLLLYGLSVKAQPASKFVKNGVRITTGGIEGTERSIFEAYDAWIAIAIGSVLVLILVMMVLHAMFFVNIEPLKPVYDFVNNNIPGNLPPL